MTETGEKCIPAGKSLTEVLTGLFFKEVIGTLKVTYSWSPSLGKPSISVVRGSTGNFTDGNLKEVNDIIKVTATANNTISGNIAKVTVEASEGYFTSLSGSWNSGNYTQSKTGGSEGTSTVTATLNDGSIELDTDITLTNERSYAIAATNSGIKATVPAFDAVTVYNSKNTKTVVPDNPVVVETDKYAAGKDLSNNASTTITAVYPIYSNGVTSKTTDTSAPSGGNNTSVNKLPLVKDSTTFGVAFADMTDGGAGYRIYLKEGKKISSAIALNGMTSKYDINVTAKFVEDTVNTVTLKSGGVDTVYHLWEYKGTEGANRVNFIIANK